jgi:hypothetical protein
LELFKAEIKKVENIEKVVIFEVLKAAKKVLVY